MNLEERDRLNKDYEREKRARQLMRLLINCEYEKAIEHCLRTRTLLSEYINQYKQELLELGY